MLVQSLNSELQDLEDLLSGGGAESSVKKAADAADNRFLLHQDTHSRSVQLGGLKHNAGMLNADYQNRSSTPKHHHQPRHVESQMLLQHQDQPLERCEQQLHIIPVGLFIG